MAELLSSSGIADVLLYLRGGRARRRGGEF